MKPIEIRINTLKIKKYIRENLGASAIIGFMVFLLSSAVLLSTGHTPQADKTAEYAYYLLVIGVILQLVSFTKEGRAKQEEN